MPYLISLLIIFYNESFRNSLQYYRNLEFEKGDSLLNVAFFESDSLLKNDILFVKEILLRYREVDEVKNLAEYFLNLYFAHPLKDDAFEKSPGAKSDVITYLKLLRYISEKDAHLNVCKNLLGDITNTILLFHGTFMVVKKFKNSNKEECIELMNSLVKNYPHTPYSEIASGYIRMMLKSN